MKIDELFEAHRRGVTDERAMVVKWLRNSASGAAEAGGSGIIEELVHDIANAIEDGDHYGDV